MRKNKKNKVLILALLSILFSSAYLFWGGSFFVARGEETTEEEKVEENEEEIEDLEKKLEKEMKEKDLYVKNKLIISNDISQISANINTVESLMTKTEQTLDQLQTEIEEKQKNVEINNERIAEIFRDINKADSEMRLIMMLENSLEGYFSAIDLFQQIQEKIYQALEKQKIEKTELEEKRKKQQEVFEEHKEQKEVLALEKNKKNVLLNYANEEIEERDASISEIQSKISELRSDISKLLGKSYDTGEIKDAIKFANKQTGVRKGFLFGMLSIESRLGASVGNCNYKESRMNETRKKYFKQICDELDYDYKKQKVSCPPASYKGTGGAMGAAQFMSDTWMGYKSQIASATGNKPPDPWNLVDGVMAMALKLKNDGATKDGKVEIKNPCDGKKIKVKWETYASMKYLGWSCYALTSYAPRIQALAGGYDKL